MFFRVKETLFLATIITKKIVIEAGVAEVLVDE
jgi:hypothetical protein